MAPRRRAVEGRLGDGASIGSAAEMACAGQSFKIANLLERDVDHKPSLSLRSENKN
jgi:hypothetical protein